MMLPMRTTVTLDADTEAVIRRRMRERGVSFKVALNDVIREGHTSNGPRSAFCTPTTDLGRPTINLDRALQLAAELEDEELLRKLRLGK